MSSYDSHHFEDFQAVGLQEGHKEPAFPDAFDDYSGIGGYAQRGPYDGPMRSFFKERKVTQPHRYNSFAPSADNAEHAAFFSLAAQGAHVKEFGEQATRELLATENLRLGQIKKPVAKSEIADSTNPFSDKFSGTPAQKEARIASLINSDGGKFAAQLAKAAGKTITGGPLQAIGAARQR
jgi:hypothetical protein